MSIDVEALAQDPPATPPRPPRPPTDRVMGNADDATPPPKKRGGFSAEAREKARQAIARKAQARKAADAARAGVGTPPQHAAAAPVREEDSAEKLTRVPRGQRDIGEFVFPPHRRRQGWDYQLIAVKIYNEPQSTAEFWRQGWRPVPPAEAPELQIPGHPSETLDIKGLRWFWRPEHMSAQAREEDRQAAVKQQQDRMFGAATGKADGGGLADVAGVRPVNLGFEMYGEAGNFAEKRG